MAYAVGHISGGHISGGHISGGHFNPAVSFGL
jgi:glycerol uptake facilitator-like aquaporin